MDSLLDACEDCGTPYLVAKGPQCGCTKESVLQKKIDQLDKAEIDKAIFLLKQHGYRVLHPLPATKAVHKRRSGRRSANQTLRRAK
jgi:hypothetical protein